MKKVLVINGPNLNLLGLREPALYGARNFKALEEYIQSSAAELSIDVELFQSNHEGVIVDKIQAAYGVADAILINPAAYTHTSVAILDALKAVALPTVEVHLTDIGSSRSSRYMPKRPFAAKGSRVIKRDWNIFQGFRNFYSYAT